MPPLSVVVTGKIIGIAPAVFVAASIIAAYVFVPDEYLGPAALGLLMLSMGALWALREYLKRLNALASRVGNDEEADRLRDREVTLTSVGVAIGLFGLAAFIVALIEYAD